MRLLLEFLYRPAAMVKRKTASTIIGKWRRYTCCVSCLIEVKNPLESFTKFLDDMLAAEGCHIVTQGRAIDLG